MQHFYEQRCWEHRCELRSCRKYTSVLEIKKEAVKACPPRLLQQICRAFIILHRVLNKTSPVKASLLNLDGGLLGSLAACSPACQTYGTTPSPPTVHPFAAMCLTLQTFEPGCDYFL